MRISDWSSDVCSSDLHAEEWHRGRTGLLRYRTGQRRNQNATGFGLPPGIDDRATRIADHLVIPAPGFRVDRFADRAEQTNGLARRGFHKHLALAQQRAEIGREACRERVGPDVEISVVAVQL